MKNAQRNRIDRRSVKFAVKYGSAPDPEIFTLYARALLEREVSIEDKIFAFMCLNENLSRTVIDEYFGKENLSNEEIILEMIQKLESLSETGGKVTTSSVKTNQIETIEVF